MKRFTFLLSLVLIISMINFGYAQSSGGGGGGGSGGGDSLGLRFIDPLDGAIMGSPLKDALVSVRTDVNTHCEFTGQVCDGSNCKDISYRECIFCDLDSAYFSSSSSYWDKVEGWAYEITANCRDESGNL